MKRTERQARDIFSRFQADILDNKHPKAINTQKFSDYVAAQTGYTLKMVIVPMGEVLRGIIVRKTTSTPKEALILISDFNNECWTRFTLIKEVCHLFLTYETEITSDNALEMAQALMRHVTYMPDFLPVIDDGEKELDEFEKALQSLLEERLGYKGDDLMNDYLMLANPLGAEEASAVVAAIEIMIPVINKDWITSQITSGVTLYSLASQLKVPKLILEYRLNQWFIKYH